MLRIIIYAICNCNSCCLHCFLQMEVIELTPQEMFRLANNADDPGFILSCLVTGSKMLYSKCEEAHAKMMKVCIFLCSSLCTFVKRHNFYTPFFFCGFQFLSNGGLDGQRLELSLEYMSLTEHPEMSRELQRSPALFAAVVLGGMARPNEKQPFAVMQNATLLLRVLQKHSPGFAPLEIEVGQAINAILVMAKPDTRRDIMLGIAMKVILFYYLNYYQV